MIDEKMGDVGWLAHRSMEESDGCGGPTDWEAHVDVISLPF